MEQFATPSGFNPHPAFLPGDAWHKRYRSQQHGVSIRTRHFCRVMPAGVQMQKGLSGLFQSAPGISAG